MSPAEITALASSAFGLDLEEFPHVVPSVYGETVEIIGADGRWCSTLHIEHVAYQRIRIPWGEPLHNNQLVEWMIRSWAIERIELRIDMRPVQQIISRLHGLELRSQEPIHFGIAMHEWIETLCLDASSRGDEALLQGARALYQWAMEQSLPGFDEIAYEDLLQSKVRKRRAAIVAMRDPASGPYTPTEVARLSSAAIATEIGARRRALFFLCRDLGLRPIQLALLRVSDVGHDALGPFVRVSGAKGLVRSRLRRAPSNMVKRYIELDTYEYVLEQIREAPLQADSALRTLEKCCRKAAERVCVDLPLFPAEMRSEERLRAFCKSSKITEYALHNDAPRISREISQLTAKLGVSQAPKRNEEPELLQVTAYRLRRTKGTSLAVNGASLQEIAAALDHKSTASVEHYLRYSGELHDYVNALVAESPKVKDAVRRWAGMVVDMEDASSKSVSVGNLGLCNRKDPCPYHPTVTCYACHMFRPSKTGDHRGALADIERQRREVSLRSTGAIRTQLAAEIDGARAVILAILASEDDE